MPKRMKGFPNGEAGVALTEYALALPFLMLLLVGLIEVGRFAYFAILVGNAAHAAVQYGAVFSADSAGMTTAAQNDAPDIAAQITVTPGNYCYCWDGSSAPPANPTSPAVLLTCPTGSHQLNYVTATVTGTFNSLFNYPGLPSTLTITRTAAMQATNT
jgi:Flp pilus assembly protein TadG